MTRSLNILLLGAQGQLGWQLRRSLSVLGRVTALHRGSQPLCGDLARPDELEKIKRSGLKVNQILTKLFAKAGLILVDFKLEYGRLYPNKHNIVLADEISPDTCRLWDEKSGEKLDKDRFRQDLGDLIQGYSEILDRVKHVI